MLAIRNLRLFKSGFSLVSAACGQHCAKHTLPDLPYDYNALEPVISAEIMHLHHQKHHATYVNNLNIAEEKLAEAQAKKPHEVEEDQDEWKKAVNQRVFLDYILNLKQFSPPNAGDITSIIALQPALRFNGGGHINHSIFWQNLSPNGGGEPDGDLMHLIKSDFGSFENFKTRMSNMAVTVQGSGWAWLGFNTITNNLQLSSSANQDPLQATTGIIPLFGIDVWEHAYYLQYKNARPDYVKALWNIVNWKDISERLVEAQRNAGV